MSPPSSRVARTQEERTAATRARLIEATLDLLLAKGYAGTTAVDIAAQAGLTRGALAHHFESKDELVVVAFDKLLTNVTAEIRLCVELVQTGTLSLDDFIDRMWTLFSGRYFMLTLEEVTAARHNDYLRTRLVTRTREYHEALDAIWRQFFQYSGLNALEVEVMLNATLCLLRGMGVQTVLRDDPIYFRRLLRFWKAVLREQIAAAASAAATKAGSGSTKTRGAPA